MKTPTRIVVSPYSTSVIKPAPAVEPPPAKAKGKGKKPAPAPQSRVRVRYRWRAELVRAGQTVHLAEGFELPHDAIGAVIRSACADCETADDVVDLIAGLFGDDTRTANANLGRAVLIAARSPKRVHPGCQVVIEQPAEAGAVAELPAIAAKGGAL